MPRSCVVLGCPDKYARLPNSMMHRFPNDTTKRTIWTSKSGTILSGSRLENAGVCSYHFSLEDYKITPSPERRGILFNYATPSINLPNMNAENMGLNNQAVLNIYDTLLRQEKLLEIKEEEEKRSKIVSQRNLSEISQVTLNITRNLHNADMEIVALKETTKKLKKDSEKIEKNSDSSFKRRFREEAYEVFGDTFTKNMIDMLIDNNYAKKWKDEDMVKALSIYNASSSCYLYMRDQLNFPFPSRSTILKSLSKINVRPGLITPVLRLMREEFLHFTPLQRAAIMCFDEVAIDSRVSFDEKEDIILGPYKNMMAITVRSLFYDWKQLIYTQFDDKLDAAKIKEIVLSVYDAGVEVVGLVSDMSTVNRRVWNDLKLDIHEGKYYFDHPCTKESIWVFADFPHLIKLLRNHLLDHDIKLGPDFNNLVISIKTIDELIRLQKNSDLKLTFKLTEKHIIMNNRERMNVRTAMELFSGTTAKAIRFLMPENEIMADFFEMVNLACNILNTRTRECSPDHRKCPYGRHFEEQTAFLTKFSANMMELRVLNSRPSLLPFQKGFKLICASLRALFRDVRKPPRNAKYIMTSHVNQDHLESVFGVFRGIGRYNDLPMPLDALRRVKNMIIASNLRCPKTGNIHAENDLVFVSSSRVSLMYEEKIVPPCPNFDTDFYQDKFGHIQLMTTPSTSIRTVEDKARLGTAKYVAGYIAKKFVDRLPNLAGTSNEIGWIQMLSRGNLVTPSQWWLTTFLKLEEFFEGFHKSPYNNKWNIDTNPRVTARLIMYLTTTYQDIPIEAIKFYVKLRTKIRVNAINKSIIHIRKNRKAQQFINSLVVQGGDGGGDNLLNQEERNENMFEDDAEFEQAILNLNEQEVLFDMPEAEGEEEELLDI